MRENKMVEVYITIFYLYSNGLVQYHFLSSCFVTNLFDSVNKKKKKRYKLVFTGIYNNNNIVYSNKSQNKTFSISYSIQKSSKNREKINFITSYYIF